MPKFYNIYIIYGNQFGFVDLEAVLKLLESRLCDKVVIFLSHDLHENVAKELQKYQSRYSIEVKISRNPKKSAKSFKKDYTSQNPGKTAVVYPLEQVADRSLWHDVC